MNDTIILIVYLYSQGNTLYAVPSYHPNITVLRSCNKVYAGHNLEQTAALAHLYNDDNCEIYENNKYFFSEVIVTGFLGESQ